MPLKKTSHRKRKTHNKRTTQKTKLYGGASMYQRRRAVLYLPFVYKLKEQAELEGDEHKKYALDLMISLLNSIIKSRKSLDKRKNVNDFDVKFFDPSGKFSADAETVLKHANMFTQKYRNPNTDNKLLQPLYYLYLSLEDQWRRGVNPQRPIKTDYVPADYDPSLHKYLVSVSPSSPSSPSSAPALKQFIGPTIADIPNEWQNKYGADFEIPRLFHKVDFTLPESPRQLHRNKAPANIELFDTPTSQPLGVRPTLTLTREQLDSISATNRRPAPRPARQVDVINLVEPSVPRRVEVINLDDDNPPPLMYVPFRARPLTEEDLEEMSNTRKRTRTNSSDPKTPKRR